MNLKIINLTPHAICFYDKDKKTLLEVFPPSGKIARVQEITDCFGKKHDIYPLVVKSYSDIENLPEESEEDIVYLVSCMVKNLLNRRTDVWAPDTGEGAVRDDSGKIIGTIQFVV
jgi:hypothetical protein